MPKFSFIIEFIENQRDIHKILEIGCSKGYLSAYFKSRGYDITGVDISSSAIEFAKKRFGDFFFAKDSQLILDKKPYDIIFHAGTVGCVESPARMTRELLNMLKPGGFLIFNAPNVMACKKQGDLWVSGTSPPDLVTLFHKDFWMNNFSDLADVELSYAEISATQSLRQHAQRKRGSSRHFRRENEIFSDTDSYSKDFFYRNTSNKLSFLRNSIKFFINKTFFSTIITSILPKYELEFGMYVVMKRR